MQFTKKLNKATRELFIPKLTSPRYLLGFSLIVGRFRAEKGFIELSETSKSEIEAAMVMYAEAYILIGMLFRAFAIFFLPVIAALLWKR
jgi:hypothetical protein